MANTVRYHINPETGRPNQCTATVRGCKYAVDGEIPQHYDSKAEAKAAYEKIGAEEHGETKSLSKTNSNENKNALKHSDIVVEGFDNFDAYTAEPTNFDAVSAEVYGRFLEASFDRDRADRAIQGRANEKVFNRIANRYEYKKDTEKVLAEFVGQENPTASDKMLIDKWNKANDESIKNIVLHTKLDQVYRKRGAWNRAYLVSDGHLHKSMDCSTCNKGETPTKFQWMTEYSGKDEGEIVDAAGHRACTTCYPSAPVGNETNLPSKMLTKEEEQRNEERAAATAAKEKKKSEAVSKAATIDGSPLRVKTLSNYPEEFKTERSATAWYVGGITGSQPIEQADREKLKNSRYKVLYNLALKNDKPMSEVQEELQKKVVAKTKRDYKEQVKYHEMNPAIYSKPDDTVPEKEKYDVPEELMNKSPRDWDSESHKNYTPED